MSIDYDALNRALPRLRAGLTRAKNSGDPFKVLLAVEAAVDTFDAFGWPDAWSTWRIALDDAFFTFSRSEAYDDDRFDNGSKLIERFHRVADRFA